MAYPAPRRRGFPAWSSWPLSSARVEEPPGDGSDVVEELEGLVGSRALDGARTQEETEMGVDLSGRAKGDSPVVETIAA